jgi:hypothetical protein
MSSNKKSSNKKSSFVSSLWKFLTGERPGPSGLEVAMCLYKTNKAIASVEKLYAKQENIELNQNKIKALRSRLDKMSIHDSEYKKLSRKFDRLTK